LSKALQIAALSAAALIRSTPERFLAALLLMATSLNTADLASLSVSARRIPAASAKFAEICHRSFGLVVQIKLNVTQLIELGLKRRGGRVPEEERGGAMRADRPRFDCRPAVTIQPGLGTHARLGADRPGNGSRVSAAKSLSSRTAADPHARIFGLSLAALLAASLVLNAASPSARICPQPDRDFGTTSTDSDSGLTRVIPARGGGLHVQPSAMIRPKECATIHGGEEPGY
jgi:hypothetical protein